MGMTEQSFHMILLGLAIFFILALSVAVGLRHSAIAASRQDVPPVPSSRTIRATSPDPAYGLIVIPGEQMLSASCCEKCGHVQKFWITCEE
jgi:hypothetical protein